MENLFVILVLAIIQLSVTQQDTDLECAAGYSLIKPAKCVKVYGGRNELAWHSAKEVCERYGSRLVTIKDQYDNDQLGQIVDDFSGSDNTSYWIGLSQSFEDSCSCDELKWENGNIATENMGFWMDKQPDDSMGKCIFSQKNEVDYVYDRPYAWSFDNCNRKRAFVCERMAAPKGSFHCASGGFVRQVDECDRIEHCSDGSDEMNCPQNCRFLLEGSLGVINRFTYMNSQKCTWAITSPLGSSVYLRLDPFQTEEGADFISIFTGNTVETKAERIERISGNQPSQIFRSWNNMIFLKFTTDSLVTGRGFNGTFGSVFPSQDASVSLTADVTTKTYVVNQIRGDLNSFVGKNDYVIVIETAKDEIGQIITLEIADMMINNGDYIEIYDGATPYSPILARMCNSCDNTYKVLFSTGTKMSILFRRMKSLEADVRFGFRYTQGCFYTTSDKWGMFASPGYPAAINYPNFVQCTWRIEPREPIAVYFDPDLTIIDQDFGRKDNSDLIEIYDNGTRLHSASRGFNTTQLAGNTFKIDSGILELRFRSSPIRSGRGFKGTWSIGCENPNYDEFTRTVPSEFGYYFTASAMLTCADGYAFQQQQIPPNSQSVEIECGYKGIWKNYLQIPRCNPVYCGDAPAIANGYIESSTGSTFNDQVRYQCYPGLNLIGAANITCQRFASWSPKPICQAATCPFNTIPSFITNGLVNITNGDGSKIGSIVEYTCNAGFEIVGEPIIFCKTDGTYTSTSVSCRRLTCRLPPITNGQYTTFLSAGEHVNYETTANVLCNQGYTYQNGSINSVVCQADRTLTQLPVCIDVNECENNQCETNCINIVGSYYCTCSDGYVLESNGRTCSDINECSTDNANCDGVCNNALGSYTCGCNLPFVLYNEPGVSGYQIPLGETGLLPTDTFHINHTCVLIRCPMPQPVENAQLLDKREHHRFGDRVEYMCNIGFIPRSTILQCGQDGTWNGNAQCEAATCPNDNIINSQIQNRPNFNQGPYAYGEILYLNCTKGGQTFNHYRHCTYDPSSDSYQLQGSSYECGVIDCGTIESQFSNTVSSSLYPTQFQATCPFGSELKGKGPDNSTTAVTCGSDGFWKYGNLQCFGTSCTDPGYPAGGNIVATTFSRNSFVYFTCNRQGYTLSASVQNLTCQGATWSGITPVDVNGCIDTQKPVFNGNCGTTITLKKYEKLSLQLPSISLTDNTGISSFTVFPADANSTWHPEQAQTVTYTATDYAFNTETCNFNIAIEDETPPEITCPSLRRVILQSETSFEIVEINPETFTRSDNIEVQTVNFVNAPPKANFSVADLYNTFTYTARVQDTSNNINTCKGQVFVSPPSSGCSELGFTTPANSIKTCQTLGNTVSCQITCDDAYTFQNINPKTITVTCSNGIWNQQPIPACVLDITPPDITCPISEVVYLSTATDTLFVDFTQKQFTENDLNTISTGIFNVNNRTFTAQDLYATQEVTLTVRDLAGNGATCEFQYTVLPRPCSPLALPTPVNAIANVCRRSNTGYDCDIECNEGFVLRGHGYQKTIACNDNAPWTEIYPACIEDTTSPEIVCPEPRSLVLQRSSDTLNITFGAPTSGFVGTATDVGGINRITYEPSFLFIDQSFVYKSRNIITMTAFDRKENRASCEFNVVVEASVCSDMSLPDPLNGYKNCSQNFNQGWTCTFTCETGYSFATTLANSISSTCVPGSSFNQFVPACVSSSFSRQKDFIGTLRYHYAPSSGTTTVPTECINDYLQGLNSSIAGVASIFSRMSGKLKSICREINGFNSQIVSFVSFNGTVLPNDRNEMKLVTMDYDYTIYNANVSVYNFCARTYGINIVNGFFLGEAISPFQLGNCPTLLWDSTAEQIRTGLYCTAPYFEFLQDTSLCVLCPPGTDSDGISCTPCPLGTYRTFGSSSQCQQCPTSRTTRYPGATSADQCISPCSPGFVSTSGYEPCYPCEKGKYSVSTTTCQRCNPGSTTSFLGASSNDSCISSDAVQPLEPCPIGTQPDNNRGCDLCDFGTYRSNGQSTCSQCFGQTSTFMKGAVSFQSCKGLCASGKTSSDGKPPCTACPKGTYYRNSTYCMPCGAGLTTVGVGSTSQTSCRSTSFLTVKCPRGSYRDGTTGTCNNCEIGKYQDIENQSQCKSCNPGTSTYIEGATSISQCLTTCVPGFRSISGLSPCEPCQKGTFWVDSKTCTVCPSLGTTLSAAATSQSECSVPCQPGSFSFSGFNQNGGCRQCPASHYQPNSQSTSCIKCSDNTYSIQMGLDNSNQCRNSNELCNCLNSGTCRTIGNTAVCDCPQGTFGSRCESFVNYCNSNPCYNGGICSSSPSGHTCDCLGRASGANCETIIKICSTGSNPTCKNGGHCINRPGTFQCLCADGFSGTTCTGIADICDTNPCNTTGTQFSNGCEDVSLGADLRRKCNCRVGYEGDDCSINTDDCASSPCVNGGTCLDQVNGFQCRCANNYFGTYCEKRPNRCLGVDCGQDAYCTDNHLEETSHCVCAPGYSYGTYTHYSVELNNAPQSVLQSCTPGSVDSLDECRILCTQSAQCHSMSFQPESKQCCLLQAFQVVNFTSFSSNRYNTYRKSIMNPDDDFYTMTYNLNRPSNSNFNRDSETLNDLNGVYGLNICHGTEPLEAKCCIAGGSCENLPQGATCSPQGVICSSSGCQGVDFEVRFKCAVQRVFLSNTCSLKNDYCDSKPCVRGTCRNQFNGYFCSCPLGYSGKNCQTDDDTCTLNTPCQNDATCIDGVNSFTCNCTEGFQGFNCQDQVNYCSGVSCNSRGSCQNLGTDYMCFCQPGYDGKDCENQIDQCLSNPCLHGSNCTTQVNNYFCQCVDGWSGKNCDIIVDNCDLTGRQCQSQCNNIFNGYYCECPDNTYGNNCQFQPNPCRDYNKCQNNAQCGFNGTFMTCQCPTYYDGDGCQTLLNHCGQTNRCQNGATCSNTATGYSCACPTGYTGMNCETDIDECNGVFCPGGGTCFDAIGRYYCRCPLNTTGESCSRGVDSNYDLYFRNGFAWIPYFIQVTDAEYVSFNFWIRFSMNNGEGTYLTQYIGDNINNAVKLLEINDRGIMVYGPDPNNRNGHLLQLQRNIVMNDGDWHMVTGNYNTTEGRIKFYLDTVLHDEYRHDRLILDSNTFKMWVILGCEFDNMNQRCTGSDMFDGYLSQIVWYKRELTFNDIAGKIELPQRVFLPLSNVILLWYEYLPEFGAVERIIPSQADRTPCSQIGRNPPCSFARATSSPIKADCPDDMTVYSSERLTTVSWTSPQFTGLGPTGIVKQSHPSGNTHSWGIFDVVSVAQGENGYSDYCSFRVYVQESQCAVPEAPFGGRPPQCSENNPVGRKGCRISCYDGRTIDRMTPSLFTCDPSGTWNYTKFFEKYRYPSCGEIKNTSPQGNVQFKLVYNVGTTACNAVIDNLKELIRSALATMNQEFQDKLCSQQDCQNENITIDCGEQASGRKKRQTISNAVAIINLFGIDMSSSFDGSPMTAVEYITYMAIGNNIFDFPLIINQGTIVESLFTITVNPACGTNEVVMNNQCVECGAGNYFRYTDTTNTTGICDDCPLGTYQSNTGQSGCVSCLPGETTELPGNPASDACKESCKVGSFFNMTANRCSPCPIGYYQDEVGQFRCKGCNAGFTTEFVGTNSSTRCTGTCESGQQLDGNGNCKLCSVGTYRNASETRLCVPCTGGFITAMAGARSSSQCNVTACEPGNKLNVMTNLCEPCPIGTYQPLQWQTSCSSCGDPAKFLTLSEGKASETDCQFYCSLGSEVADATTQTCKLCDVGFYKAGNLGSCTQCTGNLRTPQPGAVAQTECSIYKCPVGSEPNATNNGCNPCALGDYQDEEYGVKCKTCSAGQSTRMVGSNSSNDCEVYCPSGQEKMGSCVICSQGSYKNNDDGLFSMCQPCNTNYTTNGQGSISVNNCTVRACEAGTKRNADDSGCIDCPMGTYQPASFQRLCIDCSPNLSTRSVKSTRQDQCESFCASGSEKNAQGTCDSCSRGYYKDNNNGLFSECELCPSVNITISSGSTKITDCIIGNCTAGQRLRQDNICEQCPIKTYQPNVWQSSCLPCGLDKTTENEGSKLEEECILVCQPGEEDVNQACQPCQRGYYKVEEKAAKCTMCPGGNTTESMGATSPAQCNLPGCLAGTYLDRITDPQNPTCKPCGYDSFQDQIWQESCQVCLSGRVTLKTSATMSSDCVDNCTSGQAYNSITQGCDLCEIGYYRDNSDRTQTGCQLCDVQFITANRGSVNSASCTIANCTAPGYYRQTSSNTCQKCPIGTYNSQKWVTTCQACQTGFSTRTTGAASASECRPTCPLGQYVSVNNICARCPIGSYRSSSSAENCTECPNRLLTPNVGSVSESACTVTPCGPGNSYDLSECRLCPIGTYQPAAGSFQCIGCENGYRYTSAEGSVSASACNSPCLRGTQFDNGTRACIACPRGTYQDQDNQFMCKNCQDGLKYTASTGSTSRNQCLSFCANTANLCSTNATCTTQADGALCNCFANYDDIGSPAGTQCVHKCDRAYCKNGATCYREPTPRCECSELFEGNNCQTRVRADSLADDTRDIVIPVSIGAAGLVLFLILLAVCCLCWMNKRKAKAKRPSRYSEYNDRIDKASMHSYDYGPYPYNGSQQRFMLARNPEIMYDNQAYIKGGDFDMDGSIDTAVYQA